MFFKFILLGISLTFVLFFVDVLIPKLISKYRYLKMQKLKNKKQKIFDKDIKKLEIK